ncbi:hypothetical protein C8R43DRAFT_963510 [Mycena crocata]|nr:hypothetical protein C8R43DRAFT_963510 [Mycena crocata]
MNQRRENTVGDSISTITGPYSAAVTAATMDYFNPTAGMGYQPIFDLPVNFADMNGVDQMRAAGIDLTPQSMLDAFKKHHIFTVTPENEAVVLYDIQKKIDFLKVANFELFGVAPTATQASATADISWVVIPGIPEYILRFYPGGKQEPRRLGTFFMDVCDTQTGEPVVIPGNFAFFQLPIPDGRLFRTGPDKAITMECIQRKSMDNPPLNVAPVPEKFSFFQGTICELQVDGSCVMRFSVPLYPIPGGVVQPVSSADLTAAFAVE